MGNLDFLLDVALSAGELASGVAPEIVLARTPEAAVFVGSLDAKPGKPPRWTPAEDDFLRENLGYLTDEEMGAALGRSVAGVKIRRQRELRLPAPSKHPDFLTGHQVARILGVDAHKVTSWIDRGLLRGEHMAGARVIRRVRKVTFLVWACAPKNWIWFDPDGVQEPHLWRLIQLEKERWGDEWWDTTQVADFHGVDTKDVLRQVKLGKLAAVRADNRCGRHNNRWANWFVRKSDAVKVYFYRRKGSGRYQGMWTPGGDEFILKAKDEWGLMHKEIARMMKWPQKRVEYRYRMLRRQNDE